MNKKYGYNDLIKYGLWIITLIIMVCYIIKGNFYYVEGGAVYLAMAIFSDVFFKVFKIKLSKIADLIMQLFIFATLFVGRMYNVYGVLPWWDTFLHGLSGVLIALGGLLFLMLLVKREIYRKLSPICISTFAFMFSLAAAGMWEIWEFVGDQLFGLNSQLNSLLDTMTDICSGTVGGLIISVFIYIHYKKGKFKWIGEFVDTFANNNK